MARSTKPSNENKPISSMKLSADTLKNVLWDTLNELKSDRMLPAQGDAIAAQAREILRTVKVQLMIVGQAKHRVPADVIDFAERQGE
jgi:hypothetical protein